MRLSAESGSGGAGDIDSSELYADMRLRLEVRIRQRAPGGVVGSWGGDGRVARARSELSKMPECRIFEQPVLLCCLQVRLPSVVPVFLLCEECI